MGALWCSPSSPLHFHNKIQTCPNECSHALQCHPKPLLHLQQTPTLLLLLICLPLNIQHRLSTKINILRIWPINISLHHPSLWDVSQLESCTATSQQPGQQAGSSSEGRVSLGTLQKWSEKITVIALLPSTPPPFFFKLRGGTKPPVCIHTRWGWTSYNLQYLLCISTDKHSPHYQQHRKAQAKKPRRDIKLFANLAGCDPTVVSFCHYYYYKCANATVGELRAELRTQNGLFGFTVSSFCTATWQRPLLRCLPQDTATLYGLSWVCSAAQDGSTTPRSAQCILGKRSSKSISAQKQSREVNVV